MKSETAGSQGNAAKIPATLIPGDGIGPEISEAAVAILDALGAPFEWDDTAGRARRDPGGRRPAAAASCWTASGAPGWR